ncbi:MAG: hypothetical protein RIQ89_1687 [Bacteroidota bacterium]|jgi:hypothetical protein
MKKISPSQSRFAVITTILSITFFFLLHHYIKTNQYNFILPIAVGYSILMFFNGLINGYYDHGKLTTIDKGFIYHLLTFLIVNLTSLGFILLQPDPVFSYTQLWLQLFPWGLGLYIHYLCVRNSIQGYSNEELFK